MNISSELRKKVDEVFEKFEEFKIQFEKYPYAQKQQKFFQVMEKFRIYLANITDEKLIDMVMHSERYVHYKKYFRDQNDYFMRALETVEALDIINKNTGVDSTLLNIISTDYLKNRYLQKSHDLRLANLSNIKKIVMVGCGPFPDTLLYLYENTNIPELIGLDYNEEAIFISAQFIENLGFDRIKLQCMDGTLYDYADADLIYIAGFVHQKDEVLKQIAETSTNKNAEIIVDSALGMQKLLFENVNNHTLHPRLKIDERDYSKSKFYVQEMIKITKYDI